VNNGEAVFTAQIFSAEKNNGIELFNSGNKTKFSNLQFWEMKTVW
jgi:sucrose-6-phosphate hydrolase SacC (GH32 family)